MGWRSVLLLAAFVVPSQSIAQAPSVPPLTDAARQLRDHARANYTKYEHLIPMRDGARLFTAVYVPKDDSRQYPILLNRTPYSVAPYGIDNYKEKLGPSELFQKSGYIFVYQDVRGRWMSEGTFANVRPHRPSKKALEIDESSDAQCACTGVEIEPRRAHHVGNVHRWASLDVHRTMQTGVPPLVLVFDVAVSAVPHHDDGQMILTRPHVGADVVFARQATIGAVANELVVEIHGVHTLGTTDV